VHVVHGGPKRQSDPSPDGLGSAFLGCAVCLWFMESTPHTPAAHASVGIALGRAGNFSGAVASLQQAVTLEGSWEMHTHLGIAQLGKGDAQDAVQTFGRAINLQSNEPTPYKGLGKALLAVGEPAQAAEAFRTAQALEPEDANTAYNLGVALCCMEDEEAAEVLRPAAARHPEDEGLRDLLFVADSLTPVPRAPVTPMKFQVFQDEGGHMEWSDRRRRLELEAASAEKENVAAVVGTKRRSTTVRCTPPMRRPLAPCFEGSLTSELPEVKEGLCATPKRLDTRCDPQSWLSRRCTTPDGSSLSLQEMRKMVKPGFRGSSVATTASRPSCSSVSAAATPQHRLSETVQELSMEDRSDA